MLTGLSDEPLWVPQVSVGGYKSWGASWQQGTAVGCSTDLPKPDRLPA
jgi:hypothetical protein